MRSILPLSLLAMLLLAGPLQAAVTVKDTVAPDGTRRVVMENAALRLTIDPARGGRVSSFVWKRTGADWVPAGNSGFLMDHVWQQTWPGELLGRPYEVRVLEAGPERGTVQASVTIDGRGDKAIEGVRLVRTMTLTGDSPRLQVRLRLENPTTEPRAPGLWVQNVIQVGGSPEEVWSFRPSTRGVIRASWDAMTQAAVPPGYKDDFIFDPVAGWTAETHPPTGEGVAFLIDYNHLRCLYNNAGSQSAEWWYEQAHLAPGKAFETAVTVWPFQGLRGVSHADHAVIAEMGLAQQGTEVTVTNRLLAGPEPPTGALGVRLQLLDYGTGVELGAKDFPGVAVSGVAAAQELKVAGVSGNKNLLARATLRFADGKQQVYESFQAAGAVLGTEKAYRIPRPARVRPVERPATIAKTPHEGFRLLHLRGLFHEYYKVPQTARALHAQLQYGSYRIFVYGPSLSYFPSSYPELMSFDAMVINNVPIEAFDEISLQYLKDYVENGGVLLVIGGHWAFGGGGYQSTPLEEFLPVTTRGLYDVRSVQDGFLTPALPLGNRVGSLWVQQVDVRPEAQVRWRAGKAPFWVEWQRGKGRVAVMTGVCYGEAPAGMTLFWEWYRWPRWLAERLREMVAQTGQ